MAVVVLEGGFEFDGEPERFDGAQTPRGGEGDEE
jgi:hypothetical protein